ncbi:hypothetical protein Ancab_025177 [Ancistrocladus abbreviatus]
MGQIVRRKKKGRPSKADLAARLASATTPPPPPEKRVLRRSLRRRSFRYNIIDYDEDYLDDDFEVEEEVEEEEEEEDEENERKREKKLKLVLKLPNNNSRPSGDIDGSLVNRNRRTSLSRHATESDDEDREEEERDEEEDEEEKDRVVKKRKINGGDCDDDGVEDADYEDNDNDEGRRRKGEPKDDSVPGTPTDNQFVTPLPEKKQLELILDKLQKKDTYGVYSEPVDPDELPDYHDIIEHPMDFATVRKKLGNGSYSTLGHFESDVFLICSNAMQYNAPDTIYHKQARTIKELAEKKFQRIRNDIERFEKEPKSEPKAKSNSLVKKQTKKPIYRSAQEPLGSDFSSGATLATADAQNNSHAVQTGNCEKPSNNDVLVEGISTLAENNAEKGEDLLSGKGLLPKFGRKSFVVDENRRTTYDITNQPMERSESIFTTFDGEKKQLVTVGLHGEHSYARSLARFSATLGPVAWRIASKRIKRSLPVGFKFGCGWVGEYEPLPTPILVLETQMQKDPFLSSACNSKSVNIPQIPVPAHYNPAPANGLPLDGKSSLVASDTKNDKFPLSVPANDHPLPANGCPVDGKSSLFCSNPKNDKFPQTSVPANGHPIPVNGLCADGKSSVLLSDSRNDNFRRASVSANGHPISVSAHCLERKSSLLGSDSRNDKFPQTSVPANDHQAPPNLPCFDGKSSLFSLGGIRPATPKGVVNQQQNPLSRSNVGQENKIVNRIESSCPTTVNPNTEQVVRKQPPYDVEMLAPRPGETTTTRNNNSLQSLPFKQPDSNGVVLPGGLPNGKFINNSVDINQIVSPPSAVAPAKVVGYTASFLQSPEQGLSDPVQVMRILTEQSQKPQNGLIPSHAPSQVRPSVPSPRGDNRSNAAVAAASVWMSVGAGGFKPATEHPSIHRSHISADSLYNTTRDLYPHLTQPQGEVPLSGTMHLHSERKSLPFPAFIPQPVKVFNEVQGQNRPMAFPQLASADLSRFQVQSPWQGLSPHTQQRQKQDKLPPDLNIAFQSSVDSQQPDLALQL